LNNLSIVLCSYNEALNIYPTLIKLTNKNFIKEIIIIDDNSTDGTIKLINEFNDPKINLIVRKKESGFASAFIKGINLATGKYILRFDFDMHDDINFFLENFLLIEKSVDLLIFSRYVDYGSDERSIYRNIPSHILNLVCSFFLSNKVKDYTSCIMILKKSLLSECYPKQTNYANFIIEFVYDVIIKKKNIKEIGFIQKKNTENNSKSAPNILKFFLNGLLYFSTIFKCFFKKK